MMKHSYLPSYNSVSKMNNVILHSPQCNLGIQINILRFFFFKWSKLHFFHLWWWIWIFHLYILFVSLLLLLVSYFRESSSFTSVSMVYAKNFFNILGYTIVVVPKLFQLFYSFIKYRFKGNIIIIIMYGIKKITHCMVTTGMELQKSCPYHVGCKGHVLSW